LSRVDSYDFLFLDRFVKIFTISSPGRSTTRSSRKADRGHTHQRVLRDVTGDDTGWSVEDYVVSVIAKILRVVDKTAVAMLDGCR
jgi:hypothetical protein